MYDQRLSVLASIGLAVGGILGMTGTFAPSAALRGLAWGIDGVALVMAGAILTVVFYRAGQDFVASGFLVFAIGEGIILSGAAMDLDASTPSFRSREQPVGDGACSHQPSALTHLVPIAFFRLSTLRRDLLRLDLDALEGLRATKLREMRESIHYDGMAIDTVGAGHVYQGRFTAFVVQQDAHLLTLCRYVVRTAVRAQHVERAEQWRAGWVFHRAPCAFPLAARARRRSHSA